MARTPSNMIELGSKAPDFKLVNTIDNKLISSNDFYKSTYLQVIKQANI